MDSKNELNEDILSTISKIKEDSPELNRLLDEMPIQTTTVSGSGISNRELVDYLNSLKKISQRYSQGLEESS